MTVDCRVGCARYAPRDRSEDSCLHWAVGSEGDGIHGRRFAHSTHCSTRQTRGRYRVLCSQLSWTNNSVTFSVEFEVQTEVHCICNSCLFLTRLTIIDTRFMLDVWLRMNCTALFDRNELKLKGLLTYLITGRVKYTMLLFVRVLQCSTSAARHPRFMETAMLHEL